MSKLAHSNQATMDEIEARSRDGNGEIFNMNDEATIFAAHLLIPEELLRTDLLKIGAQDIDDDKWIDKLCKRYRVSRGLMQFRLRLAAKEKCE